MSIETQKIADLKPDSCNANKGTQRGLQALDDSLRQFGAGRSILVDKAGRVIAGNKTLACAADVGMEDVIVVESDGTKLIAVKRTDLDLDSDDGKARRLAYADNRVAELDLDWDVEQIAADLADGLDLSGIWDDAELADLLPREPKEDSGPQLDKAEELRQKWGVESGQLWRLGEHRLICGDCTDAATVARVTGGEKIFLMVTDPPYGVDYDPMFRQEALGAADRRTGRVQNDTRADWREAWALFSGDVAYCWSGMITALDLLASFQSVEFEVHAEIIWCKSHLPFGRGHYVARHEACWYLVRKGKKADWVASGIQDTLWHIALDESADGGHGTQKPLECMERPIQNHSGDVYDPFLGSGTTLIACERLGRKCRAVEIEPKYVAVTLERWANMTGETPVLLDENDEG